MISNIYDNPYALWKTGNRKGKSKEQIKAEEKKKLKKGKRKIKIDILKK